MPESGGGTGLLRVATRGRLAGATWRKLNTSSATGGAALVSTECEWWHVVWTTFLVWPPADERGDWRELADLYARIAAVGGTAAPSEPLPVRWLCRPLPTEHVALPAVAVQLVSAAVRELADADRIAGNTPMAAIAVTPLWVQAVLSCPAAALGQRVGRLKSRLATLLSFEPALGIGGAGTWGRGFWWAALIDELAIGMASAFVRAGGQARHGAAPDPPKAAGN